MIVLTQPRDGYKTNIYSGAWLQAFLTSFRLHHYPFSYNKDRPLSRKRLAIEFDKLSEAKSFN